MFALTAALPPLPGEQPEKFPEPLNVIPHHELGRGAAAWAGAWVPPRAPSWSQLGLKSEGSRWAVRCPLQRCDGAHSSPVIRVTFLGCGCQHQPLL